MLPAQVDEGERYREDEVGAEARAAAGAAAQAMQEKGFRSKAVEYLVESNLPGDDLVVLRVAYEAQSRLMDGLLTLSSQRWENNQLANFVNTGRRDYR